MEDPISKALDLTPVQVEPTPPTIRVNQPSDFEYARGNLINIIEKGNEALDGILDVAGMSQHPRSYEVAANLIKTMAEVNKDLMDLAIKKKNLDGEKPAEVINNNLFVGSTAELQKLLKQNNEKVE
jgi:hypothetical protein